MAKKPQRRPPKISEQKREEMFQAFCEKPNCEYVSSKCEISWQTAARYRDKEDWDGRLQKIREKAAKKADSEAAERRARHIQLAKVQQKYGAEFFVKGGECISAQEACLLMNSGIKNEREAAGEAGEITQQKFIIEVVRGDSDPSNPNPAG